MKYGYRIIWLVLAFAAGLFGGIMHGHELVYCYDATTGLYTYDTISYLLPALCACAAVLFLIAALTAVDDRTAFPVFFSLSHGGMTLQVAASFLILAGGAVLFAGFLSSRSVYDLLLGVFTVFAGICFIRLGAIRGRGGKNDSAKGAGTVVLFWICAFLLYTFMEHPVEPILQVFAYDLLAMCAAALAVYCETGRAFKKYRARLGAFAALTATALLTAAAFGRLSAVLLSGRGAFAADIAPRFLVMLGLLLLCAQDAAAYLRLREKPENSREA